MVLGTYFRCGRWLVATTRRVRKPCQGLGGSQEGGRYRGYLAAGKVDMLTVVGEGV
jgi:hypothetical protein